MSTWFDRPLTLAGRVIVKGEDAMNPQTLLLHVKRPLLQISNLAIHFNRQVNDGVKLSKQKDVLPILGIINDELEKGNLLMNVITGELNILKEDILDFDLYLADATPACTFGVHDEFISSGRLDDLSMCSSITTPRGISFLRLPSGAMGSGTGLPMHTNTLVVPNS